MKESFYRRFFQSASNGLFVINAHGRIIEANPAVCAMHGYIRDEVIGMSMRKLVHPDNYHLFAKCIGQVCRGEKVFTEAKTVRKCGTVIDVEVYGWAFISRGRLYILGSANEISERKKNEKELRDYIQMLETTNLSLKEQIFSMASSCCG